MRETADNLRSQLTQTPSLPDSVRLEPLGTNLYVRNYEDVGAELSKLSPVTPLITKEEKRTPANTIRPLSAKPERLGLTKPEEAASQRLHQGSPETNTRANKIVQTKDIPS